MKLTNCILLIRNSLFVLKYQKYGLVIVEEYLSHELGKKLEAKLGLPVEEKVQQKALVTSAKGTKSIMSFFGKKQFLLTIMIE